MTLAGLWLSVRAAHRAVNAWLQAFYRMGPGAHDGRGVIAEFLDDPTDGVLVTWAEVTEGLVCYARDRRGRHRVEMVRRDGTWSAEGCSCLAFQEIRRECRHLRAARQALTSREGRGEGLRP